MTDAQINECFASLGRAFAERRDLRPKIDKLKKSLVTVGNAAAKLGEDPHDSDSELVMQEASDVREDFAELKRSLARLSELDKILS